MSLKEKEREKSMVVNEKLKLGEFDRAVRFIVQEAILLQEDLERAADLEDSDLKKSIMVDLITTALGRMNNQAEVIKTDKS